MDMRSKITASLVFCLLILLTGCASMRAVQLNQSFWQEKGKRVGVALVVFPPAEVFMDISGELGQAVDSSPISMESLDARKYTVQFHNTMPLYDASRGLDGKAFEVVYDLLIQGLKERGLDAFKVEHHIDVKQLPRGSSNGIQGSIDHREILRSANADYLILMDLRHFGTICRYLGLNLFEVDVYADIHGEMIEAATNRVLWRTGISDGYFTRTLNVTSTQGDQIQIIFGDMDKLLVDAAKKTSQKFFERNR